MKKLISIATLLGFALLCMGNVTQYHSAIARKKAAGGASYLIQADFEDAGTPTGWTASAGSPDFDYTTTVIDGTQSLSLPDASAQATASFTAGDERWGYFRFRVDALTNTPFLLNDVAGFGFRLRLLTNGKIRLYNDAGTELATGTFIVAVDTVYNFWWRCKKGTGANAEFDGYIASSTAKPATADITSVAGDMTNQVSSMVFDVNVNGTNLIVDSVLVDDADIGSNPWGL